MNQTQKNRIPVNLNELASERFEYPELIESLLRVVEYVAHHRTGGGEALAQLLMGCYDGGEYRMDLTELCRLDDNFFEDALKIIRLRCRADHEPHTFFVDGGRLFNQIAADFRITPRSEEVRDER